MNTLLKHLGHDMHEQCSWADKTDGRQQEWECSVVSQIKEDLILW